MPNLRQLAASQRIRIRFRNHQLTLQRLFAEDARVITCAGGSAVSDLAALLVKRHFGDEAEKNVQRSCRWNVGAMVTKARVVLR